MSDGISDGYRDCPIREKEEAPVTDKPDVPSKEVGIARLAVDTTSRLIAERDAAEAERDALRARIADLDARHAADVRIIKGHDDRIVQLVGVLDRAKGGLTTLLEYECLDGPECGTSSHALAYKILAAIASLEHPPAVPQEGEAKHSYTFCGKPIVVDASIQQGALRIHPATYQEWVGCAPGYYVSGAGIQSPLPRADAFTGKDSASTPPKDSAAPDRCP